MFSNIDIIGYFSMYYRIIEVKVKMLNTLVLKISISVIYYNIRL